MSSQFKVNELLQVDICDVFTGENFDNFEPKHQDDFCGFERWTESPSEPSPAPARPGSVTQESGTMSGHCSDTESRCDGLSAARSAILDCLLVELYETCSSRRTLDSWDSSTEASGSDAFLGRSNCGSSFLQELQLKHTRRLQVNYLQQKAPEELQSIIQEVKYRTSLQSAKLIRQLRRRDRLCHKLQKNYDIITACLQAVSQKRRVDTRLKFTIEPSLGKNGFQQWYDALKAVARLHTGIPKEWRKRVWLTLADQYLHTISIDWEKTLRFAFNERSNPDDDSLGVQIVKDLHRTGCSSYCGQEGEQDRVVLKRVLLAFARWNKSVGYCQGFNVLAALILEVTEGDESDALKVMIYLIDKVLPESYFANNLRALSVDMAVFRDLLRLKLPRLSQHLHHLQKAANREAGGSYEPPLTNVFTMQWFLTMFATCLPSSTVLKIWDSVFFEGSEILFRVALAIWERLGERIEYCPTADDFYSTMGCLTQEMLEKNLVDPGELMQEVYSMAVFPFPQLSELREKYTYNITPFPTSVKSNGSSGVGSWESDDDDADMDDEDSVVTALGCLGPLGGLLAPELQRYHRHLRDQRTEQGNFTQLSPGAVGGAGGGARAEHQAAINSMMMERMSTDIYALKKQYTRIKRRQQQQAMQLYIRTGLGREVPMSAGLLQEQMDKPRNSSDRYSDEKCPATRVLASQLNPSSAVINHLLLGRKPRSRPTSTSHSSPCRQHWGSLPSHSSRPPGNDSSESGSPWRAHVRVHRRNVARARAQLGFEDSEEREDEGEEENKRNDDDDQNKDESDVTVSPSSDPSVTGSVCEEAPQVSDETNTAQVSQVVVKLENELKPETQPSVPEPPAHSVPEPPAPSAADVPAAPPAADVPAAPPAADVSAGEDAVDLPAGEDGCGPSVPPPSSNRHKESDSSASKRNTTSSPPSLHLSAACMPSSSSSSSILSSSLSPVPTSLPSGSVSPTPDPTSFLPLSLPASSTFYKTSCPSTPSLCSISLSSKSLISSSPSTPVLSSTSSTPKQQQLFSPFPSVKHPRKSPAARNLGLYGPTSRTPTVHFPQLSRSRAAGTTDRR
ncbi:TBC1 domain family member 30 isoform X1 [Solea solea]|uniref:TBC1 domain family member 30 isoform X1 n=1 Tax=Solea solea TaxID=90069 RepID=UPI00272C3143|nr:TBC1 domain family member 30 isoform X1 [Solea solea]